MLLLLATLNSAGLEALVPKEGLLPPGDMISHWIELALLGASPTNQQAKGLTLPLRLLVTKGTLGSCSVMHVSSFSLLLSLILSLFNTSWRSNLQFR